MEITRIEVEPRTARGRRQIAQLRSEGMVPAVLYGRGKETLSLSVLEREVDRHVRQHHKVFNLRMQDKEQAIFLQAVQWDPLTDRALHIDFLRIDLNDPLHVVVELVYFGHPVGISKGGRLVKDLTEIKVVCLPQDIPDVVELKVAGLDIDDHVYARDLQLPDGVTLDMPADTLVCHLTLELEAPPPVEAPPAEGAEPTAPEGAGTP